jgi:hypothetical protein
LTKRFELMTGLTIFTYKTQELSALTEHMCPIETFVSMSLTPLLHELCCMLLYTLHLRSPKTCHLTHNEALSYWGS